MRCLAQDIHRQVAGFPPGPGAGVPAQATSACRQQSSACTAPAHRERRGWPVGGRKPKPAPRVGRFPSNGSNGLFEPPSTWPRFVPVRVAETSRDDGFLCGSLSGALKREMRRSRALQPNAFGGSAERAAAARGQRANRRRGSQKPGQLREASGSDDDGDLSAPRRATWAVFVSPGAFVRATGGTGRGGIRLPGAGKPVRPTQAASFKHAPTLAAARGIRPTAAAVGAQFPATRSSRPFTDPTGAPRSLVGLARFHVAPEVIPAGGVQGDCS